MGRDVNKALPQNLPGGTGGNYNSLNVLKPSGNFTYRQV
jgi:hypothetical protein